MFRISTKVGTGKMNMQLLVLKEAYKIQLVDSVLLKVKKGVKSFTKYKILVDLQAVKWYVYRRYTDFETLYEDLKSRYKDKVPGGFPGKKLVNNMSPHFIDKRQKKLSTWLGNMVIVDELISDEKVQMFLQEDREEIEKVEVFEYMGYVYKYEVATQTARNPGEFKSITKGDCKRLWISARSGAIYKYSSPKSKHPYSFVDVSGGEVSVFTGNLDKLKKGKDLFLFVVTNAAKAKFWIFGVKKDADRQQWMTAFNQMKLSIGTTQDPHPHSEKVSKDDSSSSEKESEPKSKKKAKKEIATLDKGDNLRQRIVIGKAPADILL